VRSFNFRLGLLGVGQGVEETKKLLDARDGQGSMNAVADADKGQGAPLLIMGDVGTDQGADAGGIDVGDAGEIDDEGGGVFGADRGLELEQSGEYNRALETENSLTGLGTFEIVDMQRFLGL